jgi:hypothetical protein
MRKYYLTEFNTFTEYKTKKRYHGSELYEQKLDQYISFLINKYPLVPDRLRNVLGSLFYPKDCKDIDTDSKKVHEYLYKFSMQRLQELMSIPAMKYLYRHYYDTQIKGTKRRVQKNETMNRNMAIYMKAFEALSGLIETGVLVSF